MIKFCKKWWFYLVVSLTVIIGLFNISGPSVLTPYKDYIFYGIAQNKVTSGKLKVVFSVRGFPAHKHTVYTEIMDSNGVIDWLATVEHTGTHKAHYHKSKTHLKPYKAEYDVSRFKKGKYKIRLTFEFKHGISGHLNPVPYYSNWVAFEIK